MCLRATIRIIGAGTLLGASLGFVFAQTLAPQWRHIGNAAIALPLPSVATGAVDRVWYSEDGSVLYARTASGRIFQTSDFEQWQRIQDSKLVPPAAAQDAATANLPEASAKLGNPHAGSSRLYAVGQNAYRSDDAGLNWSNVTAYKGVSILGGGLVDVTASPQDPDEVVVASRNGVWRSVDGGLSWSGLNQFLPNLPASRIAAVPAGSRGLRLAIPSSLMEVEWAPGEKTAWTPLDGSAVQKDLLLKTGLSQVLKHSITALATAKEYIYAGDSEGRMLVSPDAGTSWNQFKLADMGSTQAIWVDPNNPRVAIAVLGARAASVQGQFRPTYVLHTMNGGLFWDDITANLPETAVAHGVTADRASGAVYVATDAGVFFTTSDLASAGQPTSWAAISDNLPTAAAVDVKLDPAANQLYVALDGYGVYSTIAPHRFRDAKVVNAADYSSRPAAPGSLLSVLGARVDSARTSNSDVAVLAASDSASQIQVPFDAKGSMLSLSLRANTGQFTVGLPLQSVSPAIFVDPEGTPLIMDSDSGVLLDASKTAHSGNKVRIFATGFGRVTPDWPTGLAAPMTDPPRVVAPVKAYLNGQPLDAVQAVLAPGYVGFYLIEIQLPRIVNAGPAELYLEAEGQQSNRVRLYIEP